MQMNCLFLPQELNIKRAFFAFSVAFLIPETSGLRLPLKEVDVCPFWPKNKIIYEFNNFCFHFYIF